MRDCVALVFGVLLFSASVICEDCVTFDFEDGIDGHFVNDGICAGLDMWVERTYSSLPMESPHAKSNYFITPTSSLSCVKSFSFEMSPTGVLEVNVFMKSTEPFDQISVLVHEISPGGNDAMVGNIIHSPSLPGFVEEWQTLKVTTINQRNFNGYITLMGMAAPNSIVLIDSFRYLMPSSDEDLCKIYDNNETTTEADVESTTEADIGSTTDVDVGSTTETDFGSTTDTDGSTTTDPTTITETNDWSSTESVTVTVTDLSTNDLFPTTDQTTSGDNTTEKPDEDIPKDDGFWTPLTITLLTLVVLISFIIIACVFYRIGRGRATRRI